MPVFPQTDQKIMDQLSPEEQSHHAAVQSHILNAIRANGGQISFDRYMELALYAPGLGYYAAGTQKFGEAGDFITAPEVSPVFGRCLARQCQQVLNSLENPVILEFGAGTGRLAADILTELSTLDALPRSYCILELSATLRQRQQELLAMECPELMDIVIWLDSLPETPFSGLVLANELLDAMPVSRFRLHNDRIEEEYIRETEGDFVSDWQPASEGLEKQVGQILEQHGPLSEGYLSEVNRRLTPWFAALSASLRQVVVLLIDYGYTGQEYYHPERDQGTLICHHRHQMNTEPLQLTGLQDITANVDFSAVADAALSTGFELAGYTTQAHFLIDTGLDILVQASDPDDVRAHTGLMQGIKTLTLPNQMGERFKVIALRKEIEIDLMGFRSRDLSDRL